MTMVTLVDIFVRLEVNASLSKTSKAKEIMLRVKIIRLAKLAISIVY